jgi:DNA polymerase epsilon subunit 4
VARVKKIIAADDDLQTCSNNASFVVTIATEMFIQHLVEKAHEIVRAEKRPRKNIQYADIGKSMHCIVNQASWLTFAANAVARLDNLEFLSDVVPRTTTFKKYVNERGKDYRPGISAHQTGELSHSQVEERPSSNPAPFGNQRKLVSRPGGSLHLNGTEGGMRQSNASLLAEPLPEPEMDQSDAMLIDERSVSLSHDPVQEQLAMEMERAGH